MNRTLTHILRYYRRQKSALIINLIGLSAGMTCVLLIFLWARDEMRTDRFHAVDERLFRVMANHYDTEKIRTIQETPDPLAEALAAELPEVEASVSYLPAEMIPVKFILSAPEANAEKVKARGQFADKHFLRVLSYPLLLGNPEEALASPNNMVISEKLARNLFQTPENAMGKTLEWQITGMKKTCVVSAVIREVPSISSNQFDFLLTMAAFHDPTLFDRQVHWDNHAPNTLVVLKSGVDQADFSRKIAGFVKTKLPTSKVELFLQPYADHYLYGKYENGVQAGGRIEYLRLLGLIALFILFIAAINFVNLSTAQAASRTREVGVMKAVGIGRGALMRRFLGESTGVALAALIVATGLVYVLLPEFNAVTGKSIDLKSDFLWMPAFLATALVTGLCAGIYPAFYLSGFNPVQALKGRLQYKRGEAALRKSLVIAQFGISTAFMIAVAVIYAQIQMVKNKDMGFDRTQVVQFNREGRLMESQEAFIEELKKIQGVENASGILGDFIGENSFTIGVEWPEKQADETITFTNIGGRHDLIETLGIEMAEGRAFSRSDSSAIIFNEAAIKAMRLENPIGKTVRLWGENRTIIGVTRDFHLKSLREQIQPTLFRPSPDRITAFMVRLEAGDQPAVMEKIGRLYTQFNPGYAFEYHFLDADFQKQNAAELRISTLSKYFAGLAVLLSCLGLFGLAIFSAERRTREIGIRKVLGASAAGITRMLAGDFLKLVLIAVIIAAPFARYIMEKWLSGFAYRVELQPWMFLSAGLVAVGLALSTIGFHSLRAALANPVESLRND